MNKAFLSTIMAGVLATVSVACSREPDVEQVPVGTEVQLTRKDGGVVAGKLEAKDAEQVKVDTGRVTRTVARKEVADVKVVEPGKPVVLPAIAKFREFTVPAGTTLHLTVKTTVSSDTNNEGEPIEANADLSGRRGRCGSVAGRFGGPRRDLERDAGGQSEGRGEPGSSLHVRLGARRALSDLARRGRLKPRAPRARTPRRSASAPVIGAAIGAIAGGGKGAATGAAIGGGAGTAYV
jgi:hypothetical protein